MSDRGQTCGPNHVPVTIGVTAIVGILIFQEVEVAVQAPPSDVFLAKLMAVATVGLVAILWLACLYTRPNPEEDDPA